MFYLSDLVSVKKVSKLDSGSFGEIYREYQESSKKNNTFVPLVYFYMLLCTVTYIRWTVNDSTTIFSLLQKCLEASTRWRAPGSTTASTA